VLDPLLRNWLLRILVGRSYDTGFYSHRGKRGKGSWVSKASGVIAGLPVAARVFQLLGEQASFIAVAAEVNGVIRGRRLHGRSMRFDGRTSGFKLSYASEWNCYPDS